MNTLLAGRVALVTGKINLDNADTGFYKPNCIPGTTRQCANSFP